MDVIAVTAVYEDWLRQQIEVVQPDLDKKHKKMAKAPFPFLRATFYRWVGLWREACPDLAQAPELLAVGDLHVENFGTWRDAEGRLVWGLNDADEAAPMPYTIDLVRLATSALLAAEGNHLKLAPKIACAEILDGYADVLKRGGKPFVLEEEHEALRSMAYSPEHEPQEFWQELRDAKAIAAPAAVRAILVAHLPKPTPPFRIARRVGGLGGLGRPRYTALAQWNGGFMAREAKALVPSAYDWAIDRTTTKLHGAKLLEHAVRCPDPFLFFADRWQIRRHAPRSSRIELTERLSAQDEHHLMNAMGRETANVHLGSAKRRIAVLRHLRGLEGDWLLAAARRMAKITIADWKEWKQRWKKAFPPRQH